MFDKTVLTFDGRIPDNINVSSNVRVTEVKAPTDDSVRLFKELREKASTDILAVIPVKLNGIEAVVAFQETIDAWNSRVTVSMKININGKETVYTNTITESEYRNLILEVKSGVDFSISTFTHWVKKTIANLITEEVFNQNKLSIQNDGVYLRK